MIHAATKASNFAAVLVWVVRAGEEFLASFWQVDEKIPPKTDLGRRIEDGFLAEDTGKLVKVPHHLQVRLNIELEG